MTVLRLLAATLTSATASLASVVTLPLVGIDTTAGLWLTTLGIAAGLIAICSAVLAMVALMPPQPLTAPQEPAKPLPPVVTARVVRSELERPVLALPAGRLILSYERDEDGNVLNWEAPGLSLVEAGRILPMLERPS